MKSKKTIIYSMLAGAALGATASMIAMGSKPKNSMKKTAGNAIKAVGSFVENMSF